MYSEIWFPDLLDSEKWLSSLFNIRLNCNNTRKKKYVIEISVRKLYIAIYTTKPMFQVSFQMHSLSVTLFLFTMPNTCETNLVNHPVPKFTRPSSNNLVIYAQTLYIYIKTKKIHGLSPLANYTDRATAVCRRSDCQLLRIEGATWSA
jgi:hypothetical protein